MALPQTSHSNHVFLVCIFEDLTSGPLLTQRPAPPRAGGLQEPMKDSLARAPVTCKPTNPEPALGTTPLWGSRTQGHRPPALITPWAGARQPGTAPALQGPLRVFKLASPNPAYPAPPVRPHRNHGKGSGPPSSVMPSGSRASPVALSGVPCLLLLGDCEYKLLSWHSFAYLHGLPYPAKANPGSPPT